MNKHKGKYAWTVKVGEKGQIVIPKKARDIFDINPGDTLIILGDEQQGIAIPPKNALTKLNKATLFCTGRDIESREIELEFNSELCVWAVENDSLFAPEIMLPDEMQQFIDFSKHIVNFEGSNTELAESFNTYSGLNISPKTLKQMMNRYQHELEKHEVFFESHRSNGKRYVLVYVLSVYNNNGDSDASASSDAGNCECSRKPRSIYNAAPVRQNVPVALMNFLEKLQNPKELLGTLRLYLQYGDEILDKLDGISSYTALEAKLITVVRSVAGESVGAEIKVVIPTLCTYDVLMRDGVR